MVQRANLVSVWVFCFVMSSSKNKVFLFGSNLIQKENRERKEVFFTLLCQFYQLIKSIRVTNKVT